MKPILRDYIYFTRSQRKALIIISVFIGLLILFNQTAHLIFDEEAEFEIDYLEVKYQDLIAKEVDGKSKDRHSDEKDERKFSLFPFDPNQISIADWQKLGLSEAQANSIIKYREKGGSFKVKSDLKRMYVVSKERYAAWEPYIQLPDHWSAPKTERTESKARSSYENITLDLNLADSAEFTKLRGIGPVYASRIVKFRNALGGFYSTDQLTEVWGLTDSVLNRLRPQLKLTETKLSKLKINQLEAAELKSHPYLGWQEANAIVNYRKQHGPFREAKELSKIYSIGDSLIKKVSPYLKFD